MGILLSWAAMTWSRTVLAASTRSWRSFLLEAARAVLESRTQRPREASFVRASIIFIFRNPFVVAVSFPDPNGEAPPSRAVAPRTRYVFDPKKPARVVVHAPG